MQFPADASSCVPEHLEDFRYLFRKNLALLLTNFPFRFDCSRAMIHKPRQDKKKITESVKVDQLFFQWLFDPAVGSIRPTRSRLAGIPNGRHAAGWPPDFLRGEQKLPRDQAPRQSDQSLTPRFVICSSEK